MIEKIAKQTLRMFALFLSIDSVSGENSENSIECDKCIVCSFALITSEVQKT